MSREFESLLDQWLNRIDSEEDLLSCLEQNPEQAERLEPLLRLALEFRGLAQAEPRAPSAAAAGRSRFLAQAIAMRDKQEQSRGVAALGNHLADWWASLLKPSMVMARGLVTAVAIFMLLVVSLGGGALAVSANSLPGDPLYAFKLGKERVQLWLTFNDAAKQELQAELEGRRLEETKVLLDERRAANVAFTGTLDRVSDTVLIIGGVTVTLPINISVDAQITDGDQIKVEGWTQPDGSFLAQKLEIEATKTPEPTLEPTRPNTATAIPDTATPLPTHTALPTDTDTPVPSSTHTPTSKPSSTFTAVPTDTPKPVDTVTHTPSPTNSSTPEPTSTQTLTLTPTRTLTPTNTRTPKATPTEPRVIKLQFEGTIRRIGSDSWQIGSENIIITAETVIDKRGGAAEVGAQARATAVRRDDGVLVALEIVITRAAESPPEITEFQGIIESFGDAEWVVSGTAVHIVPSTDISGTPVVGWLAWVRTARFGSGPLIATNIRVTEPEVIVQFEGVIQQFGGSQWVIAGQTVAIVAETTIEGTPAVGRVAEVEALLKSDGRLIGRWIRVHEDEGASPGEEPTAEATATPTATAEASSSGGSVQTPTLTTDSTPPPLTRKETRAPKPTLVTETPSSAHPVPTSSNLQTS